jgi:hypothetical protein
VMRTGQRCSAPRRGSHRPRDARCARVSVVHAMRAGQRGACDARGSAWCIARVRRLVARARNGRDSRPTWRAARVHLTLGGDHGVRAVLRPMRPAQVHNHRAGRSCGRVLPCSFWACAARRRSRVMRALLACRARRPRPTPPQVRARRVTALTVADDALGGRDLVLRLGSGRAYPNYGVDLVSGARVGLVLTHGLSLMENGWDLFWVWGEGFFW